MSLIFPYACTQECNSGVPESQKTSLPDFIPDLKSVKFDPKSGSGAKFRASAVVNQTSIVCYADFATPKKVQY